MLEVTRIPDPKKRPEWAKYWAQDSEGGFWWAENKLKPGEIGTPGRIEKVKHEDMIPVTIYPLETGAKA